MRIILRNLEIKNINQADFIHSLSCHISVNNSNIFTIFLGTMRESTPHEEIQVSHDYVIPKGRYNGSIDVCNVLHFYVYFINFVKLRTFWQVISPSLIEIASRNILHRGARHLLRTFQQNPRKWTDAWGPSCSSERGHPPLKKKREKFIFLRIFVPRRVVPSNQPGVRGGHIPTRWLRIGEDTPALGLCNANKMNEKYQVNI